MVQEAEAPAIIQGIVACATCDNVYRAHEGRQTCPTCGGDPGYLVIDYSADTAAASGEEAPIEGDAAAPPPAGEVTPAGQAPAPEPGPSPSGDESGPAEPAAGGQARDKPSRRRRPKP